MDGGGGRRPCGHIARTGGPRRRRRADIGGGEGAAQTAKRLRCFGCEWREGVSEGGGRRRVEGEKRELHGQTAKCLSFVWQARRLADRQAVDSPRCDGGGGGNRPRAMFQQVPRVRSANQPALPKRFRGWMGRSDATDRRRRMERERERGIGVVTRGLFSQVGWSVGRSIDRTTMRKGIASRIFRAMGDGLTAPLLSARLPAPAQPERRDLST